MKIDLGQVSQEAMRTLAIAFALVAVIPIISCSTVSHMIVNETKTNKNSAANSSPVANHKNVPPPESLIEAGEYAENIYDQAKANDWTRAQARLDQLREAVAKLPAEAKGNPDAPQLSSTIPALQKAVGQKDQQTAMKEANQITLMVANMSAHYKTVFPVEITKLDYLGWELEIWAAANDSAKLQQTTQMLRQTWNGIRPSVEAHGGVAEAKKFDALVAEAESAKSSSDYERVAKRLLDEVDNLEKLFEK